VEADYHSVSCLPTNGFYLARPLSDCRKMSLAKRFPASMNRHRCQKSEACLPFIAFFWAKLHVERKNGVLPGI